MKTKTIVVERIPESLWREVKAKAAIEGRTIQSVVADALTSYLKYAA